jgi:hypothetical protein
MIRRTVLVLVLALLVVGCGADEGTVPADTETGSAGGAPPSVSDSEDPADNAALFDVQRELVVTSFITLEVDSLRGAYLEVGQLARSAGGFVADGSISSEDERGRASLRLRVPATRHDELLNSLRDLDGATIKGEQTTAQEVTAEYTDLQSRLRNLKLAEAQYQTLIERAESVDDILAVTAQLRDVRGEIERYQGQLNVLDDLIAMATINVTLVTPPAVASEGQPSPAEVISDAVDASIEVAHFLLNAAIVLIVVAIWVVPASVVGLLIWKRIGKRVVAIGNRILSW